MKLKYISIKTLFITSNRKIIIILFSAIIYTNVKILYFYRILSLRFPSGVFVLSHKRFHPWSYS